jgi:hypothetical protein
MIEASLVVCIGLSFTMVLHDVIPAKAGIQVGKTGFRIKSGMTKVANGLLRHYTSAGLPSINQ